MKASIKRIVIVGGGFAGLNLAKKLANHDIYQVTLVDKNNYHFFPPLLYQVSTAFIEPSNISYPFRRMFQEKRNLSFFMGELQQINHQRNYIETENGTLHYDYLVLAMGTETNYFGMDNVKEKSMPMKTIDDALKLRNHVLLQLEEAARSQNIKEKEKLGNVVIAGGGPTGVEIAGMLAEMGGNIVSKDYPTARKGVGKIYLVDALGTLLAPMSKKSQDEAYQVLSKLGVQIMLNTTVKDYTGDKVIFGDGQSITAATLIWASGVIGRPAPGLPEEVIARGRRIMVDEYNKVNGLENVFALGDISLQQSDEQFPKGHPQLAQVALQQSALLAHNFLNMAEGKSLRPFKYNDKGSMAIIAKFKAVVDLPKGFFKGFFAWLVWLFIHIIPIAGFRNKWMLAMNWFWSFVTNDPTLRLIIRPEKQKKEQPKKELQPLDV
ncbi:FAD-dependent pyridine nucleotide-disulphide oxidoreductase [Pedobacter sp. BAL39]|uniref:NAD(P)/FAD-dependent oxidoreductase n=1 Tax=Pedobacter sp. BAL39 TaxID=391596 RepID=UPI000155AA19|nr:NAD(P)/FAD-dependent oxidoreductase [Pedobacter sp. BAL39]EDM34416.1 FAD-dependent pyridine nucleotide-disulphide oxidoreductase [Pedobacter sp. BAL39]